MLTMKSRLALFGCLCMMVSLTVDTSPVAAQKQPDTEPPVRLIPVEVDKKPVTSPPDEKPFLDDHLKCYTVHDSLRIEASVDLDSEQFGLQQGCEVTRTRFFCAPVDKDVAWLTINGEQARPLPIKGDELVDNRICYQLRCPKSAPEKVVVEDQFGRRVLYKSQASMLCTPASVKSGHPVPLPLRR